MFRLIGDKPSEKIIHVNEDRVLYVNSPTILVRFPLRLNNKLIERDGM